MVAYRKPVVIEISDLSDGTNTTEDSTKIGKKQAQDSFNAILRKSGIVRRPGMDAMDDYDLATASQGLHIYRQISGTEKLIHVSGGKLYSLDSTGTPTEIYDLTGSGDAYFADYLDKCFITNGTACIKLENATGYQMGIAAPTGASAAALAGGSLSAGDYTVYASYGRGTSLFSVAQSLGTVTLAGGNGSIRITFPNSSDPQVSNKIIWITEPSGSVTYFYHQTEDNTTTTVDVTSTAQKNTSLLYSECAVNNGYPGDGTIPVFEFIHAFDGRIWGSYQNVLYYSLQNTSNVYDMERFFWANKNEYGFDIEGIFSIGDNLYLNTKAGIIKQPSNVNAQDVLVDERWYFYHMNTVKRYRNGVIGLTNDGVKFFDGEQFFDYDLSYAVRKEIEKIYSSTAGYDPCAVIYRRPSIAPRTEYHLFYNDDDYTKITNNKRLVLNLNRLEFLPEREVTAPWEIWGAGANHVAVDSTEVMYCVQSHATAPKIYKETVNHTYDSGIYQLDGTLATSTTESYLKVVSRTFMLSLDARVRWHTLRILANVVKACTVTIYMRDVYALNEEKSVGTSDEMSLWDSFVWDTDSWDENTLIPLKTKLPMDLKGYLVYIKIEQTANDKNFQIFNLGLEGIATKTRFT
jgi:hypothetical protein